MKGWNNVSSVAEIEKTLIKENIEGSSISSAAEDALIGLLEKCKEENLQVLFVATPWEIGEKYQKKNKYIGEIIESYGFRFLDCNLYLDEIGLDFMHDFYNRRHTNMAGAEKVTQFIGEYILDHYDLEAEHSTEVETDWNNMLTLYNAQAEEIRAAILNAE